MNDRESSATTHSLEVRTTTTVLLLLGRMTIILSGGEGANQKLFCLYSWKISISAIPEVHTELVKMLSIPFSKFSWKNAVNKISKSRDSSFSVRMNKTSDDKSIFQRWLSMLILPLSSGPRNQLLQYYYHYRYKLGCFLKINCPPFW